MAESRGPHRILVVEDSPTQAAALAALLEGDGYAVDEARSAEAALAHLADPAAAADLVLSDVVMPGMSGYELCRRLKQDPARRDTPVVLLTSLADPMDIVRGLECGADNYITKPYEPEPLLARVRRVFETRALRRETPPSSGVDVTFLGTRFTIDSSREQILDLLISSFEELVRTNAALRAAEAERAAAFDRERAARLQAEAAQSEAERANRAKSDFLAMMSHDLRTPLNAIGGYTQIMSLGLRGPVTPEQVADLGRIQHNQAHLLSLVNDILNLARIERREVPLQLAEVPLHAVLSGVQAVIEPQLLERGLTYRYEPCDAALVAHADRERVEQILVNLLANAVKFTPAGGAITLACAATPDAVHVTVSDTGPGIPREKQEQIFEPFVQVDPQHAGRQGVGLGLAISRNLARLMDGDLSVRSEERRGSTFTLVLPRVPAPVVPTGGLAAAPTAAPSSAR